MSTTTKNLNLIKPELRDPADITLTNENWDKLDTEFGDIKSGKIEYFGDVSASELNDCFDAVANSLSNNTRKYFAVNVVQYGGCLPAGYWLIEMFKIQNDVMYSATGYRYFVPSTYNKCKIYGSWVGNGGIVSQTMVPILRYGTEEPPEEGTFEDGCEDLDGTIYFVIE